MIKNYNEYIKEGLSNFLKGPDVKQVYDELGLNDLSPKELFIKSLDLGFGFGMSDAIKKGFDVNKYPEFLSKIIYSHLKDDELYDIIKNYDFEYFDKNELYRFSKECAMFNKPKSLELFLKNGVDAGRLYKDNVASVYIENLPEIINLLKYYKEHPTTITKKDRSIGFKLKKFLKLDESLLDKMTGYSEEEIKNNFLEGKIDIIKYLDLCYKQGWKKPSTEEIFINLKELPINDMLYISVKINFIDGIKFALEHGADIHHNYDSVLRLSVIHDDVNMLKYLIQQGANINTYKREMVYYASIHGNMNVIKYIIDNYDPDVSKNIVNIISNLIKKGEVSGLKYFISKGYDIMNYIYPVRCDILVFAAYFGQLDVVKYLIEQGADFKKYGQDAYSKAIQCGHTDVAVYLLNLQNNLNEGLSDFLKGPTKDELLQNIKKMKPKEALHCSIKNGLLDNVKKMIESGIDPNIIAKYYYPVDTAIVYKQYDILYYLLKHGSDINRSIFRIFIILNKIPSNKYELFLLILNNYTKDKLDKIEAYKLLYDNIVVNPDTKKFLEDFISTDDGYLDNEKNYRKFIKKYMNEYDKKV